MNPPLVSQAGLVGAWVTEAALTKDELVILESHTPSHTGTGVCSTIRGTHGNEAVWTATGKTWRTAGEDREMAIIMKEEQVLPSLLMRRTHRSG